MLKCQSIFMKPGLAHFSSHSDTFPAGCSKCSLQRFNLYESQMQPGQQHLDFKKKKVETLYFQLISADCCTFSRRPSADVSLLLFLSNSKRLEIQFQNKTSGCLSQNTPPSLQNQGYACLGADGVLLSRSHSSK